MLLMMEDGLMDGLTPKYIMWILLLNEMVGLNQLLQILSNCSIRFSRKILDNNVVPFENIPIYFPLVISHMKYSVEQYNNLLIPLCYFSYQQEVTTIHLNKAVFQLLNTKLTNSPNHNHKSGIIHYN